MKKNLASIVIGLLLGAGGMWFYTQRHPAADEPAGKAEEHEHAAAAEKKLPGDEVKISPTMQTAIGLKVASPEPAEVKAEIRGYGHVLDASSLIAGLLDIDSAQNALDASTKDYNRISSLYAQNQNASLQSLEVATTAKRRDTLLLAAAQARVTSLWGGQLVKRQDLAELRVALGSSKAALVRVDILAGEKMEEPPARGRIVTTADGQTFDAEYIGPVPTADVQTQGRGFLFLIRNDPPVAGTAITGFLVNSATAKKGWHIPSSALIRHQGLVWIYCQKEEDIFVRQSIVLDSPATNGWFSTAPLMGQEKIVITGAQVLLSEQLKGTGSPE